MCEGISCTTPLQIVQILSALLTPAIALMVAYVAYQQWQTNKATLREKLFEQRFKIFRETQFFLTKYSQSDRPNSDQIYSYLDTAQRARFFFGKEFHEGLFEIFIKAQRHSTVVRRLDKSNTDSLKWEEHFDEIAEIEEYMDRRLSGLFDHFGKFMDFSKHI